MNPSSAHTADDITVTRLCPTIGAEIGGIDLRDSLSPAMYKRIRALFVEHKVLFFRDQAIDREHQLAFATKFGPVEAYDSGLNVKGYREIVRIESGSGIPKIPTNTWHTDASFMENPSMGAVLRAIEIPEVGGDTLFADMAAAYDGCRKGSRRISTAWSPYTMERRLRRRRTTTPSGMKPTRASFLAPSIRSSPSTLKAEEKSFTSTAGTRPG
jgi:alpha-ketoglutarate-dependent taurine dioxygenase